ncbi:MAG TPA: PAS domain S-box protein, partial [Candidatus Sulfotelmatobacter sp.]|nr:PAS domain S-box protein [Candidatus Sulfotelmatobacter sp.]
MNTIAAAPLPVELPTDLAVPDLLNSLADGAYITDLNRRILCWNHAAERITGWSAEEVVGRTCFDNILMHVDKQGCALCGQDRCPLYRSIITGRSSTEPVLVFARRKSGLRAPMEVSVGPIRDLQGQIIGGIEVFRDQT